MNLLRSLPFALAAALAAPAAPAQTLFIDNATVHTVDDAGVLERADVLVRDGRIAAVGAELAAPEGVARIDAEGRPLTPALFAGLTGLGVEEVSAETPTVDNALAPGAQQPAQDMRWRPEFDISRAYNPRSAVIGVNRVEGLAWTVLAPTAARGGSFLAGQGAAVLLDGRFDAVLDGSHSLFIDLGADSSALAGGSRAAQYMLLEQAIAEARGEDQGDAAQLTPAGRRALAGYLDGGRVLLHVDRAADIRRAVALAREAGMRPVVVGGSEAWVVADELAAAGVPVLLDALTNLPRSFDDLGATLDNAARLHAAGVRVGFSQAGDASHNARKIRQHAGVAVAHGLPWDAALAGLTRVPAEVFGQADRGRIAPGQVADLVLWSGDPLEVTSWAEQVWIGGVAQPMRSRQTELFERYRDGEPVR